MSSSGCGWMRTQGTMYGSVSSHGPLFQGVCGLLSRGIRVLWCLPSFTVSLIRSHLFSQRLAVDRSVCGGVDASESFKDCVLVGFGRGVLLFLYLFGPLLLPPRETRADYLRLCLAPALFFDGVCRYRCIKSSGTRLSSWLVWRE